jgi:hypothetical protein
MHFNMALIVTKLSAQKEDSIQNVVLQLRMKSSKFWNVIGVQTTSKGSQCGNSWANS